jgi:hypothetical protein
MPIGDDYRLTLIDLGGLQPYGWTVGDRIGPEDALDLLEKRLRKAKQLTRGLAICGEQDADYRLVDLRTEQTWWVKRT